MSDFARIPILHEGRIKPLDSFARATLKSVYGAASLPDESASQFLAQALFTPREIAKRPLFLIHSTEIISMLSLPKERESRYSFEQIAAAFAPHGKLLSALAAKDPKILSTGERELLNLYGHLNDMTDIMSSFSLLAPMQATSPLTYLDALKTPSTDAERTYRMGLLEALGKNDMLLRVIPPVWEGNEEWLSPWAVIEKGYGSPQSAALFAQWATLANAYRAHDAAAWNQAARKLHAAGGQAQSVRPWALALEADYNAFDPLTQSLYLYALGLAVLLAAYAKRSSGLRWCAFAIMCVAAVIHAAALGARMAILMRPPVSTLYESMIFVSFVAAGFGLLMERYRKSGDGLLIGGVIALLLLMAANSFAADGDTLEVLVAVLNTNFWLATHVVCITTGYGSSLVAGTLAHLYLFKRARGQSDSLTALDRRMHRVALVALLFTAVGTMLGGIWADQSWGRFWGWDPKENGALWIVLWLIWLLHGRIARQLSELAFAAGLALINIVVALAWVGVNLLSVGLHSYGFTNEAANGLMGFCGFELAYVIVVVAIIKLSLPSPYSSRKREGD